MEESRPKSRQQIFFDSLERGTRIKRVGRSTSALTQGKEYTIRSKVLQQGYDFYTLYFTNDNGKNSRVESDVNWEIVTTENGKTNKG